MKTTSPATKLKNTNKAITLSDDSEAPQDAIKLLVSQHRDVEKLFSEIDGAGEKAYKKKESLFKMLFENLLVHIALEEDIFYPAAKVADKDLTLEAWEEHSNIKLMLAKIDNLAASDETFDAKIKVLKELISHHVREEEKELFPTCERLLGRELLLALGQEMKMKKTRPKGSTETRIRRLSVGASPVPQ